MSRLSRLHAALGRRTTGGRVVAEIEGFRFVAIAMVVLFHLAAYTQYFSPVRFTPPHETDPFFRFLMLGDRGVPLFFVLSGFVLALPFARHWLHGEPPVRMRPYFLRRVTRLEPPYVVSLLLLFALMVVVKGEDPVSLLDNLVASVFYVHNQAYGHPTPINSVAWSLEIEVQFYILAPLLTRVFAVPRPALRRGLMLAAIAVLVLLQLRFMTTPGRLTLSLLAYLQFFIAGFLVCDVYVHDWRASPPSRARAWDLVTLAGWPLAYWVMTQHRLALLALPLLFALLIIAAFRGPLTHRAITNPTIVLVGGMCYSIYLLHYPAISLAGRFTTRLIRGGSFAPNFLLQALLVVPVVLLVSGALYVLVERPCMDRNWPQRLMAWLRGRRGPAPAPATPPASQPVP